jgi:FkbM family methyltransferase
VALDLGTKLRTVGVLALMRCINYDALRDGHKRRWLAPVEKIARNGKVQILIGPGRKDRLSAAHFEYWGAQAYAVLTGQHELMVQEAMRRVLPTGGVMIDVGSNIGVLTLLGARLVGPSGRAVALDPARECVEAASINTQLNGYDNVTVVHAAAAAQSGEVEVIVTGDSLWSRLALVGEHPYESRRELVPAVALDDLVGQLGLDRVDLVKIDVEGGEMEVIAGMSKMLAELRPVVVCEMHGKNAAFASAMSAAGYRVINLDSPEPIETAGGNDHAFCEPMPAVA